MVLWGYLAVCQSDAGGMMMDLHLQAFDASDALLEKGVSVVEASAGTGKTYSIAMLVLRFVVEKDIPLGELLVVTYTRAATEELRGRIRVRLMAAKSLLLQIDTADSDPSLEAYIRTLPNKERALQRLELALVDMDQAPIFTIHSFCQRMLQEQALESGQLFDMELCADVSELRQELLYDFWRKKLYSLDVLHCSLVLNEFPDPQSLYASVKDVGAKDRIEPHLETTFDGALLQVEQHLRPLQRWWQENEGTLKELYENGVAENMFKKQFSDAFSGWWQQCHAFFSGTSFLVPDNLQWLGEAGLSSELNGRKLRSAAKKQEFLDALPLAGQELEGFLAACKQVVLSLRIELACEMQVELQKRLQQRGLFSFDDLVWQLADGLLGPQKELLKSVLADRFQVALIDEFQDTDVAQYQIFSTLFGEGTHFLYLIGDPKQAIYKFRGADIYAYFKARKRADRCLTLAKNYRSSPFLVQAVGTLFSTHERSFVSTELPFVPVEAAKEPGDFGLLREGKKRASMLYCSLESPGGDGQQAWSSGNCLARLQLFVLDEIQRLLQTKTMISVDGNKRLLAASDIAILVRSHKQAEAFQQTLSHGNISAVISSKKTVFETEECREIQYVLETVANPSENAPLRRALSLSWFTQDGHDYYATIHDEALMEAWVDRLHGYRKLWRESGVLAMMNALLEQESVFERLAQLPLSKRKIVNIIHLLEILQEEERSLKLSPFRLLQYLGRQQKGQEKAEHMQLRLESDEAAVNIITMHSVKGLEFPVVFCPVLWYRSGYLQREKQCIRYHDKAGKQVADLGSDSFAVHQAGALEEELAEEVRLLYVALTRGSSRTYVCWADVKGSAFVTSSKNSALAWVGALAECKTIQEQNESLQKLCDAETVVFRSLPAEPSAATLHVGEEVHDEKLYCRNFDRFPLDSEWLMTSYSALAGSAPHLPFLPSGNSSEAEGATIHSLPLGAGLGNVVHGILEDYPFSMLAGEDDYVSEVAAQCRRFGVAVESGPFMALIRDITRSPLGTSGVLELPFCLADLQEEDLLKEMPFYFHLRRQSTTIINELLAFSPVVRPVEEQKLQGYLSGFVDLVCRYRGKYYIIDYKTNYLGEYLHDYGRKQLQAAMADHNYGLQYWIYSLVLHRFLLGSLENYKYDEMFGGVFYLFARGMRPEFPGNGVYFDRPQEDVLTALLMALGGHDGK